MANTFYADSDAPIVYLDAKKHFDLLPSVNAKRYAYLLSRSSHWGTRAVLRSVSPESEDIYNLILNVHKKLDQPATNEDYATKLSSIDATSVTHYLEYASQFLSNLGNFKSFGDKKFIPRLPEAQFAKLIEAVGDKEISDAYNKVKGPLYATLPALLGWPSDGHVSSYYPGLPDITKAEVEAVNAALASKKILPENTRVVKKSAKEFVVKVACSLTANTTFNYPSEPFNTEDGLTISIEFGDHNKEFEHVSLALKKAIPLAANETQKKMLSYYSRSFESGDMDLHKKSQIEWVKDINPYIESNIGFIETYRDPSGVRGEWEGLVAMVNQDRTAKFAELVKRAGEFLPLLPWDGVYEKDKFTPPDFTSLEVMTFAGSGIPAGINIPNYDDVRLNYGFKNVSLGNVLSANPKKPRKEEVVTFVGTDLGKLFKKWRDDAFEVQVGLHELLGHGSGKLLQETSPGEFNFEQTKLPSNTTYYKPGQTWGSVFGSTSGSFEECRAELVALYLILKEPSKVLPIFGIKSDDFDDVVLIATVLMARAGLLALEFYDPETKKWGQPHMQARYGIFQKLYKSGVVTLEHKEADFSDLELKAHPEKFSKEGVETLGEFLKSLHVFKSTANAKDGIAYYTDITSVGPDFAKFRDVVLSKKLPRKQFIQANAVDKGEDVVLIEYDESEAGMIQSFVDRKV